MENIPSIWRREYWRRRPLLSAILTLVMLGLVGLLDHVTEPLLNFAIAYFIPISFAAWTLGRGAAIVAAVLSNFEAINDQIILVTLGEHTWPVGVMDASLRLLVFLFVAEVTHRLIQSASDARLGAANLRVANDELRSTYKRIDEDIVSAGLLQSSVLGFDPPSVAGCEVGACLRMAGPIGGDFADAGSLDEGRVFACVADIAGKGIPAALFTTLLKHLLIDAHRNGLRAGDVVAALNSGLSRTLPTERFVTLFYIEIDPSTGVGEYVNAGHPEGLLYRDDEGAIEDLPPTGPILNLYGSEREFAARRIELEPNDMIVLYTDGAIESKAASGERLGDVPIRELTLESIDDSARDAAGRICDGIEAAVAGNPGDDLTILCVKMTTVQEILPGLEAEGQGLGNL